MLRVVEDAAGERVDSSEDLLGAPLGRTGPRCCEPIVAELVGSRPARGMRQPCARRLTPRDVPEIESAESAALSHGDRTADADVGCVVAPVRLVHAHRFRSRGVRLRARHASRAAFFGMNVAQPFRARPPHSTPEGLRYDTPPVISANRDASATAHSHRRRSALRAYAQLARLPKPQPGRWRCNRRCGASPSSRIACRSLSVRPRIVGGPTSTLQRLVIPPAARSEDRRASRATPGRGSR